MQSNSITRIALLSLGILIALFATIQIFSTGGNVLANSFRILTPLAFAIGVFSPKAGFYLLLLAGGYLDLIKRFLIIESNFSDTDLAFMLAFAPAIVVGMVLLFVFQMATNRATPREVKLFIVISGVCAVLGAASVISEKSLRGLGFAVNTTAYLYLPLLIPRIFKSVAEVKTAMIAMVIVYLPAALWAIHQAKFGIAQFELAYLLSGMTTEVRQLDEAIFRNMGTMVSAHALSMVASILITALLLPISWKDGRFKITVWMNPLRIACIVLFLIGAYYTFSRTGWVCGICAILAFIVLQSRTLTYASYFAALAGLTTLYLTAEEILKSRVVQHAQDWLFANFGGTAEARQALVIGTIEARLESMSNFVNESSLWSPFGLKIAGREIEVKWVHDILSETLVKVGYIPLTIMVFGANIGVFMALRAIFRMPLGPNRNLVTYFTALTIGMIAAGFSQGVMILYFPINMFWCFFFAMACTAYFWQTQKTVPTIAPQAAPNLRPDYPGGSAPSRS